MKSYLNFGNKSILLFLLLHISFLNSALTQHHSIGNLAIVSDEKGGKPFYKLPELSSENGKLSVELHVRLDTFEFEGKRVVLRKYIHPTSSTIGPTAPVIRVKPGDRLTYTIHNDLAPEGHHQANYIFMLPLKREVDLKRGWASVALKADMINLAKKLKKPEFLAKKAKIEDKVWLELEHHAWKLYWKESKTQCLHNFLVSKSVNVIDGKDTLKAYEIIEHTGDHNIPHNFNTTNLHVHGLHISPYQDDIFRRLPPSFVTEYQYDVEKDHTPGTFWYHPHVHGSTALQVASGMSSALIIEDGDLSEFPALKEASEPKHERIMIFNQIMYDPETGELPDFYTLNKLRGPNSTKNGTQGTTINGIIKPVLEMHPGEVQRWRLVHSGFQTFLSMQFPEEFEVYQIAVDGIMFKEARKVPSIHMAPGNRTDILVKAPLTSPGESFEFKSYSFSPQCEYFPNQGACTSKRPDTLQNLLSINISDDTLNMQLPIELPGPGPGHEDITEVCNNRETVFNIDAGEFVINGHPFAANRIDEKPLLGSQEAWRVSSDGGQHPYHIHVNPFQVWEFGGKKVETPMWKDVVAVSSRTINYDDPIGEAQPGFALLRTRYRKYWGDFVIHCHILHHEDQGMMQRVRVVRTCEESDLNEEECENCKNN